MGIGEIKSTHRHVYTGITFWFRPLSLCISPLVTMNHFVRREAVVFLSLRVDQSDSFHSPSRPSFPICLTCAKNFESPFSIAFLPSMRKVFVHLFPCIIVESQLTFFLERHSIYSKYPRRSLSFAYTAVGSQID